MEKSNFNLKNLVILVVVVFLAIVAALTMLNASNYFNEQANYYKQETRVSKARADLVDGVLALRTQAGDPYDPMYLLRAINASILNLEGGFELYNNASPQVVPDLP